MLRLVISVFALTLAGTLSAQTISQSSTGDCSPNIGTVGGNVSLNCNLGPSDAQKITNTTSEFFNAYLKYLNFTFSVQEDDEGWTPGLPRLPDGSVDFDNIKSAPAYGTSKTSVAQFLYGREEIAYEYAVKIDEMILDAAREGEPLPFDAITFAQDIPQTVLVGEPTYSSANHAVVCVWTFSPRDKKCDLLALLRKEGSNWKIYDILSNGSLSWLFVPKQVVCNHASDTTNVRSGPSSEAFGVISTLPNGWEVTVVDEEVSPNSPVVDENTRIPYYYFKISFVNPSSGDKMTGFIFDQAIYVVCTSNSYTP